jgi:hypothetical protein
MSDDKDILRRLSIIQATISPEEWAAKTGAATGLIGLENSRQAPALDSLIEFCQATGTCLKWLLTGEKCQTRSGPSNNLPRDDLEPAGVSRDLDQTLSRLFERLRPQGQEVADEGKNAGPSAGRKFSDLSLARLAAGLIADTTLPKPDREILGDLIVAAVSDPDQRETIILIHRFLKFAKLHRPQP